MGFVEVLHERNSLLLYKKNTQFKHKIKKIIKATDQTYILYNYCYLLKQESQSKLYWIFMSSKLPLISLDVFLIQCRIYGLSLYMSVGGLLSLWGPRGWKTRQRSAMKEERAAGLASGSVWRFQLCSDQVQALKCVWYWYMVRDSIVVQWSASRQREPRLRLAGAWGADGEDGAVIVAVGERARVKWQDLRATPESNVNVCWAEGMIRKDEWGSKQRGYSKVTLKHWRS